MSRLGIFPWSHLYATEADLQKKMKRKNLSWRRWKHGPHSKVFIWREKFEWTQKVKGRVPMTISGDGLWLGLKLSNDSQLPDIGTVIRESKTE